mgnify:CR=1 FL=1
MPPGMTGGEATEKIKVLLESKDLNSHVACLTAQKEGDFDYNKQMKWFDGFYQKPLSVLNLDQLLTNLKLK